MVSLIYEWFLFMIFIGWSLVRQLDKAGCLCWECHEPDAEGVCNGLEPTSPRPLLSPITNALPEGESNADLAVKYACVVFRGVCWMGVKGCDRRWFNVCAEICVWEQERRHLWWGDNMCKGMIIGVLAGAWENMWEFVWVYAYLSLGGRFHCLRRSTTSTVQHRILQLLLLLLFL